MFAYVVQQRRNVFPLVRFPLAMMRFCFVPRSMCSADVFRGCVPWMPRLHAYVVFLRFQSQLNTVVLGWFGYHIPQHLRLRPPSYHLGVN